MNQDCQIELTSLYKDGNQNNTSSNINEILPLCKMEMFDKIKTPLLGAFYKSRYLSDLTKKIILPSKGTSVKVRAGEMDKKGGPLLVQLAFETKTLPVIGIVPILPPIEVPTMMVKPPTVISFEELSKVILSEQFDIEWLGKCKKVISSISNVNNESTMDRYRCNLNGLSSYVKTCSSILLNRLHPFLRTRIPLQRTDLLPGRHWVWDSLRGKLQKICTMMILSEHIVSCEDLV